MTTRFSAFDPGAVAFLRALKRHNDRDWFRARKDKYETLLRAPMAALVDRLAVDLRSAAPDLVFNARTAIYRPYRDTRFSENKTPLKTNIAAIFPRRGFPKHAAAGLYLEVAHDGVWVGGGTYALETADLHAVRGHVAAHLRRFRAIVESPAFRRAVGEIHGDRLQRVPRGFPKDHPAAEYLKHRQMLAGREFPAAFASSPRFYAGILDVLRQTARLVAFLNEPLRARPLLERADR